MRPTTFSKAFLILVSIIIFITSCSERQSSSEEQLCRSSSAVWRSFDSYCADSCERMAEFSNKPCPIKESLGCDCGPDRCWTGEQCVIDVKYCRSDDDCTSVSDGCCGCIGSGIATSINKQFEDEWNTNILESCKNIACIDGASDHWSCKARPACENDKCILKR